MRCTVLNLIFDSTLEEDAFCIETVLLSMFSNDEIVVLRMDTDSFTQGGVHAKTINY